MIRLERIKRVKKIVGRGENADPIIPFSILFVNPSPNTPEFLGVYRTRLLKTLREKEKLLVTSNFSFSDSVSTLLQNFLPFLSNMKLSSANSLSLAESKICCLGKGSRPKKVLKVALQILGRKFYKKSKKSSLYSKSLLIFIHKNPVVKNHPTTGEIRELQHPRSTPTGITIYFNISSSLVYILEIHRRKFQVKHLMKTL